MPPARVGEDEPNLVICVRFPDDAGNRDQLVVETVIVGDAAKQARRSVVVDRQGRFGASAKIERVALDLFELGRYARLNFDRPFKVVYGD